jgi:hypothetical protein
MASMDPTEEEISQVIDFASLNPADDRDMVIQALKVGFRPAANPIVARSMLTVSCLEQ